MNFQNFTSIVTFFLHAPQDVANGIESTLTKCSQFNIMVILNNEANIDKKAEFQGIKSKFFYIYGEATCRIRYDSDTTRRVWYGLDEIRYVCYDSDATRHVPTSQLKVS